MIYRGRNLDPIQLWGKYVDFPPNIKEPLPTYLPLVRCPNPRHQTSKLHFQVNTREPFVHCFARCGISGHYERAIAIIEGLREKNGDQPDRRAARKVILSGTGLYSGQFENSAVNQTGTRKLDAETDNRAEDEKALRGGRFQFLPKLARDYLDSRGIDAPTRGKWQIGFDEDTGRVTLPVFDENWNFQFLIKRAIDPRTHPRYLYTEGSIKTSLLYGACHLDRDVLQSRGLVLVEGPFDAIRLHSSGARNTVAILGTGISLAQLRIIDRLNPPRVYFFFDKDSSGLRNIEQAWQGRVGVHAGIAKTPIFVCRYPSNKFDPGELTSEEVARSLDNAMSIHQFNRLLVSTRRQQ